MLFPESASLYRQYARLLEYLMRRGCAQISGCATDRRHTVLVPGLTWMGR
jgi:hypothetical protein